MSTTDANSLPRHIAVIMDGNGRWAKARNLPRTAGHKAGASSARQLIENCVRSGIEVLSLFAFSSENWNRPTAEVRVLMNLFLRHLTKELPTFIKHRIQVRIIGDLEAFAPKLRTRIAEVMDTTSTHDGLKLVIAASYGGRWDLVEAVKKIQTKIAAQQLAPDALTEALINEHLSTADLPEPDLMIRTSGEQRISNFYLWQLAYSELYFTDVYWPDFSSDDFNSALAYYKTRVRRYGLTAEQVNECLSNG